ncbi:MAG: hypothetical protein AAF604_23945 [Acidobacteriota bacterium]
MVVDNTMSVEELDVLHRRYVNLSQRFRAAWVFHQFLQSLAKLYFEGLDDRYPAEFQSLYGRLKEISQSLNASQAGGLAGQMDVVERQVGSLSEALLAEDSRVDPSFLRQFFLRFRNHDDKILLQLVRFYLYAHDGETWEADRIDKIDFLLSRMGEETEDGTLSVGLGDRSHLRQVYRNFRSLVGGPPAEPEQLEKRRAMVLDLAREVHEVEDLDGLSEGRMVERYRTLKHSLGRLYFEPDMLLAVVETNLVFKNKVRELYNREERRIFDEYQQIFDLERRVSTDRALDVDLGRLREEIERFENHLQHDDLRLDDLAHIRKRVRALIPRLNEAQPGHDLDAVALDPFPAAEGSEDETLSPAAVASTPASAVGGGASGAPLVEEHFGRLIAALDGTTLGAPPKAVSLTPDVFQYGLEPREVIAYRSLLQSDQLDKPAGDWDGEVERFLLEAAALRVRMGEEMETLRELLDDTFADGSEAVFGAARDSLRLADSFLGRFENVTRQLVLDGRGDEARSLQVLRVRLMGDYSALWLLVYKQGG